MHDVADLNHLRVQQATEDDTVETSSLALSSCSAPKLPPER